MSTQSDVSSDDNYQLYKEAFNDDQIYLRLYDCKDLTVRTNHYQGSTEQQVTVGIPVTVWKKIVSEWMNSSLEESAVNIDLNDSFADLLEKNLKKKKRTDSNL